MPIEPTSVSKQPIREIESTSTNFGSWTSMQGSSTGGKDRPLNSLWEKAINGAQKLFGSDMSEATSREEKGENEDRAESQQGRSLGVESIFDDAHGFSGRRFGSFGGSAFGGNTFGSVVTSRAAPESTNREFEPSAAFDSPKEKQRVELAAKERPATPEKTKAPAQEISPKDKAVVEDSSDEDSQAKAKAVDLIASKAVQKGLATQPLVAAAPPPPVVSAAAVAPVQQEAVVPTVTQTPVAPTTTPQQTAAQTAQAAATQAKTGSGTANTAVTPEPSKVQGSLQTPPQTPAQTSVQAQAAPAADKPVVANGNDSKPAVSATPTQVSATPLEKPQTPAGENIKKSDTPIAQTPVDAAAKTPADASLVKDAVVAKDAAGTKENLGFDVAKAKEAVTESFGKAAVAKPAPQANQPAPVATQQPATQPAAVADTAPKGPVGDLGQSRLGETGATEAKDVGGTDASKRDVAATAQQRASNAKAASEASTQARGNNPEAVSVESKAGLANASAKSAQGQFARESAVAAAGRTQGAGPQGKGPANASPATNTVGVNGAAGTQGATTSANLQGAQQGNSQNSDGDPAAKQDFNAAMKQATASKGSEKPQEGGQSFEAKVEAAANRRSEAAGKASQTSYVSKTAAEVKEVVATLTKSIDRLVTDKAGAMNMKINFEGGGSLNLRISMEGGQVATSMQTDVVGLEAAIKANWGELANDWNQKGVKLVLPNFQNSEGGKDSSFENLSEFASKQERQADARNGDARGRGAGRGSDTRGFSNGNSEESAASASGTTQSDEVISDKELKTYA